VDVGGNYSCQTVTVNAICGTPTPAPTVPCSSAAVNIPDPNLLAAVQSVLISNGIISSTSDIITQCDMATITSLTAGGVSITNLEGLEYCSAVTYMNLGDNSITDLTPISGLTGLTDLDLDTNLISDITPLSGLTNLTTLVLYSNQISDITALSGLTQLNWFTLWWNNITDLQALVNNTELGPNQAAIYVLYENPLYESPPNETILLPNVQTEVSELTAEGCTVE
jgi:internalin A